MIYFNSKYLAENLKVKPAKWKRWVREFLPPDPLGGYQSGYARQYSYKDAFRVFLGGQLVGEHKFSIADARQILSDLDAWMDKIGLYGLPDKARLLNNKIRHVYIYQLPTGKMTYAIRTIHKRQSEPKASLSAEYYSLELIGTTSDLLEGDQIGNARIVVMNALYTLFIERVNAP